MGQCMACRATLGQDMTAMAAISTALLVMALGVAVWAALQRFADWLCDHDAKWSVTEEGDDELG